MEGLDEDINRATAYWRRFFEYCDGVEQDLLEAAKPPALQRVSIVIAGHIMPVSVAVVALRCNAITEYLRQKLEAEHGLWLRSIRRNYRGSVARWVRSTRDRQLTDKDVDAIKDLVMHITQWELATEAVLGNVKGESAPSTGADAARLAVRILRQMPEEHASISIRHGRAGDTYSDMYHTIFAAGYIPTKLKLQGNEGSKLRRALNELQGGHGQTELSAELLSAVKLAAQRGIQYGRFHRDVEKQITGGTDSVHEHALHHGEHLLERPSDSLGEFELREEIRALESRVNLTEDQRAIYDLHKRGLKAPEIAARLGKDPRVVRGLLHKVRKKLREVS